MLAFHDVSTGQFADPLFGLDEDHEWRDTCHDRQVDIEEMPAADIFTAEDAMFALIEGETEEEEGDIFPFDFILADEFMNDEFDSEPLLNEHETDELLGSAAAFTVSFYGRSRNNIGLLSPEAERSLDYRMMRRYKQRGFGQQRAPRWQRNHRSCRYARFGLRQAFMQMSDHHLGANFSH